MDSHPGVKLNVFTQEEINLFIEHLQDCEKYHLICDDENCAIYMLYKDKINDKIDTSSCSSMSSTSNTNDMECN